MTVHAHNGADTDGKAINGAIGLGTVVTTRAAAKVLSAPAGANGETVIVSHGDAARAKAAARKLATAGARAILSFGPAVGLAPVLRPGELVVAECVVLPTGETIATHEAWRDALAARLGSLEVGVTVARLAGRDRLASSAKEKHGLFRSTFAAALDTESHVIAEVAADAGVPFLAVRAVADPAEQNRPSAAQAHAYQASALGCLTRPWELPALWQFSKSGRAAFASLRQVAELGRSPLAPGG
ncbi:MAG: purine phosphorylase [Pseudomonadota bacterium]